MRIIWQIALNYYANHGKLPKRGTIVARLAKTIKRTPAALTETQQTDAEALVDIAFDDEHWKEDLSTSDDYARVAVKTLQALCEEVWLARDARSDSVPKGASARTSWRS